MHLSSKFAAKMQSTVLFNRFSLKYKTWSLNKLSHYHPEITGKQQAKFGADPQKTVAMYWKQINRRKENIDTRYTVFKKKTPSFVFL